MTLGDSQLNHISKITNRRVTARTWLSIVVVIGGVAVGLILWSLRDSPPRSPARLQHVHSMPAATAQYANPAGYVGVEKCVPCHAERVQEFRSSRHYLACVAATDKTMPPAFLSGDAEYTPHDSSVRFQMRKQGDRYIEIALHETPSGVEKTISTISLMYGFGSETDEAYFSWSQNRLSELPMSWLHPLQDWGTTTFDRFGSGDFSRATNPRCLECHNTWLEHLPGTPNTYRPESLMAGVTCEVCHGPAREHVKYHESHPDENSPKSIVRPATLSRQLQMDLCAYCHSNALKHRGPAFSYRPGLPLSQFYKTLTTRNPEDDHVANQTTYLKRSQCYQHSDTMTCVTCHNPHIARQSQQRGVGQSACLTCHQTEHCQERSKLPQAVRKNCVGCHMPRRNKIQVNFDTSDDLIYPPVPRWDHEIAVDLTARDEVLLEWHRLQEGEEHRTQAKRLSESLARAAEQEGDRLCGEYRFLAAVDAYRRSLSFWPSQEVRKKFDDTSKKDVGIVHAFVRAEHDLSEGRVDAGIKKLLQILDEKPDHAKAHGRLGTLYAMKGEDEKALAEWNSVTAFDPDDAYGEGMIGWYWYLHNDPQKSVDVLLRADEIEPYSFRINYNLAMAYLKLEQFSKAIGRLMKANEIEPQNVECGLLLNSLLRERGELEKAVGIVETLSKRTFRRDVAVEIARADLQAESGQREAAIATLESLQNNISRPGLQTMTEISTRLRKLRTSPDRRRSQF